jgi:hypothetical protein
MGKRHWAPFNRFELQLTLDDAASGSQPGKDASDDIEWLRKLPYVKKQLDALDPKKVRAELDEYGAWDDAELAGHDQNLSRILWLACGNVREESWEDGKVRAE